jgi:signal transduction histidine kinase
MVEDEGPTSSPNGTAERLLAEKERILELWEEQLRAAVPRATQELQPVLVDTLPALLDQLADALSPRRLRTLATEGSDIAEEHGGERVRLTNFRLEDLIAEYKLLRDVIVAVLEEHAPMTKDERRIVHSSLDSAMSKACTAYVLVQEGIRERLFALLAHDLRGPLSAVSASVQLILRKPASDQVPRWAARAADGVDRIDRMVQDLLDVMRVQAGGRLKLDLRECDLVDVARASLEELQTQHGDRFVLVAPESVRGYVDSDAIRRAVENLATNAVKYGAPSQPITITVRAVLQRGIVSVHNDGSYIPPEEVEALFRAFHRSRNADQGSQRGWGLGLAQVRSVAEAHGGSIGVDSVVDRGTTFVIDIPLDARPYQSSPMTP